MASQCCCEALGSAPQWQCHGRIECALMAAAGTEWLRLCEPRGWSVAQRGRACSSVLGLCLGFSGLAACRTHSEGQHRRPGKACGVPHGEIGPTWWRHALHTSGFECVLLTGHSKDAITPLKQMLVDVAALLYHILPSHATSSHRVPPYLSAPLLLPLAAPCRRSPPLHSQGRLPRWHRAHLC